MVPSAFVVLDELPLTPNVKVDRKALTSLTARPETAEYVAPRTPTEEKLAGIWQEVLRLERVGVHDNFFELGGDSIASIRVVSRVRQGIGVELPVRAIFSSPTIASLAVHVRAAGAAAAPALLPRPPAAEPVL